MESTEEKLYKIFEADLTRLDLDLSNAVWYKKDKIPYLVRLNTMIEAFDAVSRLYDAEIIKKLGATATKLQRKYSKEGKKWRT